MSAFFAGIFGNEWGTFVMSLVPMIELKGGIVFALSVGLPPLYSFVLAYAGSSVVFALFFFLLVPVLNLLKKIKFVESFAEKIENYIKDRADRSLKERKDGNKKGLSELTLKMLAVLIFVAIPLPLTGVWMGTAIAVFLGLKFHQAALPVCIGNLVAGLLILGLAEFCLWVAGTTVILDYILWGLLVLAIILLIVTIIRIGKTKGGKAE
ncbi:MAG: small multi-drug export protein [Clostridia bacterium]|nr:small multi-drug export protein [Clostridia bacterium]